MMLKKLILGLLSGLAVIGAVQGVSYYRAGLPSLVGHCFLAADRSSALVIAQTVTGKDDSGKEVTVYQGIALLGPFQIPQLLKIRELNKAVSEALSSGKIVEVNCETGKELSK